MMPDYGKLKEELDQQYQAAVAKAAELRRKIGEISATATAPRQVVRVTVGAQGEVRAVEFPAGAYRRMAPAELAAAVMAAVGEARRKAEGVYRELVEAEMPAGVEVAGVLGGGAGWPASRPAGVLMPDAVREYVEQGRGPHQSGG